jgi:signal transduction histidine kinase
MTHIEHHYRTKARYFLLITFLIGVLYSCREFDNGHTSENDYYDKTILIANHNFGFNYGDPSFNYIDSAYRHAEKLTLRERFKFYGFYCGYYYQGKRNYKKAMAYADSMVAIVEQSGNEDKMVREYAQAYYSKGDIHFVAGNYEEAYKYYFKTKIIAKKLDQCTSSEYNYRLGMVLYKQKRFRSAAVNFKLAFNQSAQCKSDFPTFWRRQELLNNIALSYSKANIPDSARVYYSKALTFIRINEANYKPNASAFRVSQSVIYGNLADIYLSQGDTTFAENLYKKSIAGNSAPTTDLADGQLTRIKLARLYKEQKRKDDFFKILVQVKGGMDTIYSPDVSISWNELMSDYYVAKEPRRAYEHLATYNTLRDSALLSNQTLLSGDANAQLLGLEKEYEIDILKKNSQLQRLYLEVAIVVTGLILVIAFLVYNNWQRSKHSVKKLRALNDEIKTQKKTLENTLERLERSSGEKDRILRAVAHDLRNPIGGVSSIIDLMLDDDRNSPEQSEMLRLVQNACNDSLILINELLEAANGHDLMPTQKQWVDLNPLLRQNVNLLQFKALEKKQLINTDLLPEDEHIFINREKIGRVISNLISNAIKFSPTGADILVKAHASPNEIIVSVSDPGIGIPDHIKDKIFDMFTKAKRTGTAGEKPFGLGLYISGQIVKAHNGNLWFENNADGGTTFFFRLPKRSVS